MSYNTDHLRTAGKITVYTTLLGVLVFAVVFIFNIGSTKINEVDAQSNATTSVTVLNTPPTFVINAHEVPGSATTSPTNVGDDVSWTATADDPNNERYYLLICSTNATPTPASNNAPDCGAGAVKWAVSASTTANTAVTISTTTTAVAPFSGESFPWFAWVCDGNAGTPRCSDTPVQGQYGATATSSSPFEVNHRPSFTVFTDTSPADPGVIVTFMSTSSDSDTSGTQDNVRLFVCATVGFDTANDTCTGTTLASTSVAGMASDASATYTLVIPTQDQNYNAFGYVIDSHGFEASGGAHGTDSTLTVNNVAPTVASSSISLVQPSVTDILLTVEAGETTGFVLEFTTDDNNSCDAVGGGLADEIVDYNLSIYRSGVGSTTCTTSGPYDANNCYPSSVSSAAWNLSCTASSTSCTGSSDTDQIWNCTFPLWYVADPTDGTATSTQYPTENWLAQVQGIDDDTATGPLSESTTGVEVTSFLAFALNTLTIPYGSLEPGEQTDPIVATTTIAATGNVGLDKTVTGESMCTTYSGLTPCPISSTSTIPESEQVFATGTVAYAAGTALSSTTAQEIEINVPKSIATSSQETANAFWGIRVPATITFSGDYTGENTFIAIVGESADWGP